MHARGMGARVGAEVKGAVPWAGMERVARAGDPLRARAGTCGGSARGPTSGWKVPRQGCREGVCGCAGLIRSEELVLGAARWEQTRGMRTHSVCRARAPFAS